MPVALLLDGYLAALLIEASHPVAADNLTYTGDSDLPLQRLQFVQAIAGDSKAEFVIIPPGQSPLHTLLIACRAGGPRQLG